MTILDPTSFTTLSSLMGLASSSPNRTLLRGRVGQTKEFTAVVATDAVHMNKTIRNMLDGNFRAIQDETERSAATTADAATSGDERLEFRAATMVEYGKKEGVWMCTAMIVGNQAGSPLQAVNNSHNYLPSCTDKNAAHMLIKVMIPAESVENLGMLPTEGDKIRITSEYDRYGRLNLERGVYLGMVTKRQWAANETPSSETNNLINVGRASCDEALLVEMFNKADTYESEGVAPTVYGAATGEVEVATSPSGAPARTSADESASEESYWIREAEELNPEESTVTEAIAATASTPQNTLGEILEIGHNGTLVWPWTATSDYRSFTLVVFFHGRKSGESDSYYQRAMFEAGTTSCGTDACNDVGNNGLIVAFNELGKTLQNTLFVVPQGYKPRADRWKSDIDDFKRDKGITVNKIILGSHGWGAEGANKALEIPIYSMYSLGHNFDSVYWADPDPREVDDIYDDFSVTDYHEPEETNVMYYRPANWGDPVPSSYSLYIDDAAEGVSEAAGGVAEMVSQGHFEILKTTFKVIGQRSDIT